MSPETRNVILAARIVHARAKAAGRFVIRSMSTTDAYRGQQSKPFHIYLKKRECRAGAYWTSGFGERMEFDSIEAAQAEIDAYLPRKAAYEPVPDIVPVVDMDVPTYWDARKVGKRIVGRTIQ